MFIGFNELFHENIGLSYVHIRHLYNDWSILQVLDDNFPERLHIAYVVRAPWIFHAVYKAVSPMLAADTKSKVRCILDPGLLAHRAVI